MVRLQLNVNLAVGGKIVMRYTFGKRPPL